MSFFVRNLATGLVHDVPEGHWALRSAEYELVDASRADEPPKEPVKVPPKEPVKVPSKRPKK